MPRRSRKHLVLLAVAVLSLLAVVSMKPAYAAAQATSATLVWTAPGDDGSIGRAAKYDLRYSATPIAGTDTLSWWNAAAVVNMTGKVPSTPGTADSMVVTGLTDGVRYLTIIRTADEVPNWSGYSNVAVIDLTDKIAPTRIADLRAR